MKKKKPTGALKKVTVLYNETNVLPHSDKTALLTVEGAQEDALIIKNALREEGYASDIFNLSKSSQKDLPGLDSDLFFNLCDGIGNLPHTEEKVPEILDRYNLFYTGADKNAILVTTNKIKTKRIFRQNGIPTPDFLVFDSPTVKDTEDLKYPMIVKPSSQDCSIGLQSSSVVYSLAQLQREVEKNYETYHEPVLVEEYIGFRELNLTVIGNGEETKVLPISEIIFGKSFADGKKPKIIDFDAKWYEDSESYKDTTGFCPADIPADLEEKIKNYAVKAYAAVGARDYARIDIRLAEDLTPYFLEVNVNPDLYPGMGASRAAKTYGWSYSQFIGKITSIAAERCRLLS